MLIALTIVLGAAAGLRELIPLIRERRAGETIVCGALSLLGVVSAALAASGAVFPSPLQILVVIYGPVQRLMWSLFG